VGGGGVVGGKGKFQTLRGFSESDVLLTVPTQWLEIHRGVRIVGHKVPGRETEVGRLKPPILHRWGALRRSVRGGGGSGAPGVEPLRAAAAVHPRL